MLCFCLVHLSTTSTPWEICMHSMASHTYEIRRCNRIPLLGHPLTSQWPATPTKSYLAMAPISTRSQHWSNYPLLLLDIDVTLLDPVGVITILPPLSQTQKPIESQIRIHKNKWEWLKFKLRSTKNEDEERRKNIYIFFHLMVLFLF